MLLFTLRGGCTTANTYKFTESLTLCLFPSFQQERKDKLREVRTEANS